MRAANALLTKKIGFLFRAFRTREQVIFGSHKYFCTRLHKRYHRGHFWLTWACMFTVDIYLGSFWFYEVVSRTYSSALTTHYLSQGFVLVTKLWEEPSCRRMASWAKYWNSSQHSNKQTGNLILQTAVFNPHTYTGIKPTHQQVKSNHKLQINTRSMPIK
jgi:hypothetical protein